MNVLDGDTSRVSDLWVALWMACRTGELDLPRDGIV